MEKAKAPIYRAHIRNVHPDNKTLKDFFNQFVGDQDGYRTLYELRFMTLPYLNNPKNGWGPEWTVDDTPNTYISKLVERTCNEARRGNHSSGPISRANIQGISHQA